MRPKFTPEERFWSKVEKQPFDDGCWIWCAAKLKGGYGIAEGFGRTRTAHRVAWELFNGPIPQGMLVLHRCDVRSCVNPAHLFLGTHADNMTDMTSKGRQAKGERSVPTNRPKGERHGRAKLTQDQVQLIRDRYSHGQSQSALAREFGVTQGAIWYIVTGHTWKS